jgi:TonB family protein
VPGVMPGEPPIAMNALRPLLLAALLVPAAPALAQFESVRFHPDNPMPPYPPSLQMEGITRGTVVVAVSIDAEGKVQDSLALAHTNEKLAKCALDALRGWRFIPARYDGAPVPVQTELTIDFSLEGAVITTNIVNHFFFDNIAGAGDTTVTSHLCPANRLDRAPQLVAGDPPRYAEAAGKDGVRGRVRVHFYIDEKGEVRFASAVPVGHPYLLSQAVQAVRQWKFEPPTSNGRPVLVAAVQDFDFGGGGR